jgi:hypothetical protein
MQFLQPTFAAVVARHRLPPGGASPPSRYNPHDAAYYLCDSGAQDGRNLYQAIFAYNHADWYVRKVLAQAKLYATTTTAGIANCTTIQAATSIAFVAINYACARCPAPPTPNSAPGPASPVGSLCYPATLSFTVPPPTSTMSGFTSATDS